MQVFKSANQFNRLFLVKRVVVAQKTIQTLCDRPLYREVNLLDVVVVGAVRYGAGRVVVAIKDTDGRAALGLPDETGLHVHHAVE